MKDDFENTDSMGLYDRADESFLFDTNADKYMI